MLLGPAVRTALRTMSSTASSGAGCLVGVCQMTSTEDKAANLQFVQSAVRVAAERGSQVVFLPEGCDYIAGSAGQTRRLAETLDGDLVQAYRQLARAHGVWLSVGGLHELAASGRVFNSHVVIDAGGSLAAVYRKLHLFDVAIPEEGVLAEESAAVARGERLVRPLDSPAGRLGLAICYDLRFPEMSCLLRQMGSDVLTFPSAFMQATGEAHWETLLRARAIENQCYVVAAAQAGKHNEQRRSYGRSMLVDPWGSVVGVCEAAPPAAPEDSVFVARICLAALQKVRRRMPVAEHRRVDQYCLVAVALARPASQDMRFADKPIAKETIFFRSELSYAFTNIRCVVPGHVLVASARCARRLSDLSPEEVADLFHLVVRVQRAVEAEYAGSSSTVVVQDGAEAGQTVPHVHCHVMPRTAGDFLSNDDIYAELAKHDRSDNPAPFRQPQDMAEEAARLRVRIAAASEN